MTYRLIPALAASLAVFTGGAHAAVFQLDFTGSLQPTDRIALLGEEGGELGDDTGFRFTAVFDDANPLRVGPPGSPLPGYAAYNFRSAVLSIGGIDYDVASWADDADHGVAVALFDPTNVFNPGFYAAGFFGNPFGVAPGVIGRFSGADGAWSATDPEEASLQGYLGYGSISGPTIDGGPGNVCQDVSPTLCAVVPIYLTGPDGRTYALTLGSGGFAAMQDGPIFTAAITATAVPLPGAGLLLVTGIGAMSLGLKKRRA